MYLSKRSQDSSLSEYLQLAVELFGLAWFMHKSASDPGHPWLILGLSMPIYIDYIYICIYMVIPSSYSLTCLAVSANLGHQPRRREVVLSSGHCRLHLIPGVSCHHMLLTFCSNFGQTAAGWSLISAIPAIDYFPSPLLLFCWRS